MTSPPRELYGQRLLRYAGEPSADWDAEPVGEGFAGAIIAAALCDDTGSSGGCFVYYLYENCAVADEWYESFEDALESGLTADSERHLTWNPVGSMTRPEPDNLVHATWYREFPWGVTILAFRDHSYLIDIGRRDKVALVEIGWDRWHPNFIELQRWNRGPWPRD